MGWINSLGIWFEKLVDGFKIGRPGHLLSVKGSIEMEAGASVYEYTFQEKNGTIAHIDDLGKLAPVAKSTLTPQAGWIISNSEESNRLEFYDGTTWHVINITSL